VKSIDSNMACPSCQAALQPKVLSCPACEIKVEGPFQLNEFATMAPDDLHFLRIFVRCEGRIRDMESALGLSYPTIRTRLAALKNKLAGEMPDEGKAMPEAKPAQAPEPADVGGILQRLQAGEIAFDEAMIQIKKLRANPR
jgi:hypothetical protein